jgi:hypothetical protein
MDCASFVWRGRCGIRSLGESFAKDDRIVYVEGRERGWGDWSCERDAWVCACLECVSSLVGLVEDVDHGAGRLYWCGVHIVFDGWALPWLWRRLWGCGWNWRCPCSFCQLCSFSDLDPSWFWQIGCRKDLIRLFECPCVRILRACAGVCVSFSFYCSE